MTNQRNMKQRRERRQIKAMERLVKVWFGSNEHIQLELVETDETSASWKKIENDDCIAVKISPNRWVMVSQPPAEPDL